MTTELQTVQDIPIAVRDYAATAYGDHLVIKNPGTPACLFVDRGDLDLIESMKTPVPISALLQIYQRRHGTYSYQKVFDLIFRLLSKSFLTPESESALLLHPIFKSHAPIKSPPPAIPMSFERLGRMLGPAVRRMDSWAGVAILAMCGLTSIYLLVARFSQTDFLALDGSVGLGLSVWIVLFSLIVSIRNGFKYFLLKGRDLSAEPAGIGISNGLPAFRCEDSDILTTGWESTLRFHLASILFAPAFGGLILALARFVPIPFAAHAGLGCLLVMFLDLCPFVRGELLKALDRLSGKSRLAETLGQFVSRKFLGRIFSFRSTFRLETGLIGFGLFAVVWITCAYRLTAESFSRYLGRLTDTVIVSDIATERLAAVVWICALLLPLFMILGSALRLIGANLYNILEKPFDHLRNRLSYLTRQIRPTAPDEVLSFIGSIPLFAGLPQESRLKLAGYIQVEFFGKGRTVVWQGEEGDAFYIIYSGEADVLRESPAGGRETLARLSAKDSFGEIALLQDTPRTATVRARTPLICFVLRKFFFKRFIAENQAHQDQITKIIQLSAFLKGLPMFSDVPPEVMNRVLQEIRERDAKPGEIIIREGDRAEEFFILRAGAAVVTKGAGHGWPSAGSDRDVQEPAEGEIARLATGDYFGEIALFEDAPRTATVTAREACKILVMPKPAFFEILRTNVLAGIWLEETIRHRKAESSAR